MAKYRKYLLLILGLFSVVCFSFLRNVRFQNMFNYLHGPTLELQLELLNNYSVPNKVHYVWYADKDVTFTFQQYLSVLSVHKFQKPEGIYFHTNKAPSGEYWEETLKIPEFKVIHRERPEKIFDVQMKKAAFETSDSDISRVKILIEEGGIYLDTDVWVLKSLDLLRKYDCVMGEEISNPIRLGGSIVLANKNSAFLKLWMEHYLFDYRVGTWAYNSGILPTKLFKQYPNILHVVKQKLLHPSCIELDRLYGNKNYPWRDNYTLHLWRQMEKYKNTKFRFTVTPNSMKSIGSTYGQAAQHMCNS